jgi:TonB family protein
MMASWMLYALCVGALVSIAALAAERTLTALGRPTRFVWSAAMIVSALWPLASVLVRLLPTEPRAVRVLPFTIVVGAAAPSASEIAALARALWIDRALIAAWVVASVLFAWRLVRASMRLEASRRAWKRGRVNGVAVKLSDNVGPAVVGLRVMDVVLPEWILALDAPLREIVLRHEEEHRAARDPYLLFAAAALVALLPWNVALWFQARRVRLAIEMDCDARVLRTHPSPERYGMLILPIAQRRAVAPTLFAPMLSEPTSNLERRILRMRTTKKIARLSAYTGGLITIGVLAFASSLQSAPTARPTSAVGAVLAAANQVVPLVVPETLPAKKKQTAKQAARDSVKADAKGKRQVVLELSPAKTVAPASANPTAAPGSVGAGPTPVNENQTFFEFQVEDPVSAAPGQRGPRYPDVLRQANVEGEVLAQFVVDQYGQPDMNTFKVLKSDHELFTKAVYESLGDMRFKAAEVGGKAVKQLVQMPFQFNLSKTP